MTKSTASAACRRTRAPTTVLPAATVALAVLATGCRAPEFLSANAAPAPSAATATFAQVATPDTFSVLFWNVENFFDLTNNGTEYPEYKPGNNGWDKFTYETKLNNIASVIAAANAQVAAVCEIENRGTAQALADELRRRGVDYPFLAAGDFPVATNTIPALLSKLPIAAVRGHATVKAAGGYESRNILEVDLVAGADTLTVLVSHWPSKRQAESYRVAAAESLAAAARALPPQRDYLLVGDFNADYDESDVLAVGGFDDTQGKTGINHVLHTVSSPPGRPADFIDQLELAQCGPGCHYDLWHELPENKRGSYGHRGRWTTPDHMLVPATLLDSAGISYVDNSFGVFTYGDTLTRFGYPYAWQTKYGKGGKYHVGAGYSDHLPVMARFARGAFLARDPQPIPPPDTSRAISFERGTQGWLGDMAGVRVTRDNSNAHDGHWSLRIDGRTGKQNGTVATAVLPAWMHTGQTPRRLSLFVKGSGTFSIRVRVAGGKAWRYFSAPEFKPLKSARFKPWAASSWEKLSLDITGLARAADVLQVEIRTAKLGDVAWWIDDVRVE